ncbi:hypothetical protein [Acanthopleuribacter pedis]|uniref:Uncharacterized protein n=1 Tax=Acanthopleuribacter pedis TaxID=442870 RepID=A0A8J7Q8Z5_9BACT|nr:hypothetical protein [Acanthopleuribacter pedis]MBO1320776.1 hypothetical protein [Acanthopleuribacter pedis]
MKKFMLMLSLLVVIAPASAQEAPATNGTPDLEKFSTLLPNLANAAAFFKYKLRGGHTEPYDVYDNEIFAFSCGRFEPQGVILHTAATPTTWKVVNGKDRIILSWEMEPATAIGAKGTYTLVYLETSNRFFHYVDFADSADNPVTLHWKSAMEKVLGAIDHIQPSQLNARNLPSMIEVDFQNGYSLFNVDCHGNRTLLYNLDSFNSLEWTLTYAQGRPNDQFIFDWAIPSKKCSDNKACSGSISFTFDQDVYAFPLKVEAMDVR